MGVGIYMFLDLREKTLSEQKMKILYVWPIQPLPLLKRQELKPGSREAGKPGSREAGKPGSREAGKPGTSIFVLSLK